MNDDTCVGMCMCVRVPPPPSTIHLTPTLLSVVTKLEIGRIMSLCYVKSYLLSYICICESMHIHVFLCMHMHVHLCISMYMYVSMCAICVYMCMCVYMYRCIVCVYMQVCPLTL